MNYLKQLVMVIWNSFSSSGIETNFSELKDPLAFLDSIRKREISIEEARHKQEEFNRDLRKLRIGSRSEKQKSIGWY